MGVFFKDGLKLAVLWAGLLGVSATATDLRQEIRIYPGPGWSYADSGSRDPLAPPTTGWSSSEISGRNLHWQRLTLDLPAAWADRRVQVRIGACAYAVTVYLNGQRVGRHEGAATPAILELTPYVAWSGTNVLMLALEDWTAFLNPSVSLANNGLPLAQVPTPSVQGPLGYAEWIYQPKLWTADIRLQAVPAVRIADVFIKPSVREWRLETEVTLQNDTAVPHAVTLRAFVTPWTNDAIVLNLPDTILTLPAFTQIITTVSAPWSHPLLWSPSHPHLYRLHTALQTSAIPADRLTTRFGFREFWIESNPEMTRRWFVLNGHRQSFRGESEWHPKRGVAFLRTYIAWLKHNHFNMLRLTNGGLPDYYEMADEMGICVQSEMPFQFNHKYDYDADVFWTRAERMLTDQIRTYRNHPSVLFWGVQNEVLLTSPGRALGARMLALQQAALAMDPTRAVMHEGDGDLRTTVTGAPSPGFDVQVINTHDYEVEAQRTGGVLSVLDFPNAADAYGHATSPANLPNYPYGTELPDTSKPWYIGEFGPGIIFNHPHGMSFLRGDAAYTDLFGAARGLMESTGLYYGFQIDGYRFFDHICGIAPWSTYFGDPTIASGPVIRSFFKPVTVRIKEWTAHVFAGEPVHRTLTIYNDDVTAPSDFVLRWSIFSGERNRQAGLICVTNLPGVFSRHTLTFTPPAVSARRETELVLDLYRNGALVDSETRPLSVFPARAALRPPPDLPIYVWDPTAATANALSAAGVAFTALTEPVMTGRPAGLLVIGFAGYSPATPAATVDSIRNWVREGGTALVTGGQWFHPPWLPYHNHPTHGIENFWVRATMGFVRAPHHPVMRGMQPEDFKWWAPDHLIVGDAGGNFTKPFAGFATVLVDTGGRNRGLGDAPLVEFPDGQGSTIVNLLLLFEKLDQAPVARALLQNILDYAASARDRPPPGAIGLLTGGGPQSGMVLTRMGIPFVTLDGQLGDPATIAGLSTMIIENHAAAWVDVATHREQIQRFVAEGGTVILRRLTSARAADAQALTGIALAVKPTQLAHPQMELHRPDPVTDGISNDDVFWVVPAGYRNQSWTAFPLADDVIAVEETPEVAGLLIEPSRTGQLHADSGESYNIGSVLRDTGRAVETPGFGWVRIQPSDAAGMYLIDQLRWDRDLEAAYQRKAQRTLSALLTQTRRRHEPQQVATRPSITVTDTASPIAPPPVHYLALTGRVSTETRRTEGRFTGGLAE